MRLKVPFQGVLVRKKMTYEISERRPLPPAFNLTEKEPPAQVFSIGFCRIFKNTSFVEDLQTFAPVLKSQKLKVFRFTTLRSRWSENYDQ